MADEVWLLVEFQKLQILQKNGEISKLSATSKFIDEAMSHAVRAADAVMVSPEILEFVGCLTQ